MLDSLLYALQLKHVVLAIAAVASSILAMQAVKNRKAQFGDRRFDRQIQPRAYWLTIGLRCSIALIAAYLEVAYW